MKPAEHQATGGHIGIPEICPTVVGPAVVPMVYVNKSENAIAPGSPNVLLTAAPAETMVSASVITMGDNAAVPGTNMGAAIPIAGSFNTFFNGIPASTLATPTTGNAFKCPGIKVIPSATNVIINHPHAVFDGEGFARLLPDDGSSVSARPLGGGVGLLRISAFSRDVPARAHTAIETLGREGLSLLIIDLRDNPGGELNACIALLSDFLPPGSPLVTRIDEDGDEIVIRAHGADLHTMPLVVLVNRGTASAAELFAGCLKAHHRAVIAGERTFGKGTGSALVRAGEGALLMERATFVLPNGDAVDGAGVTPDVAC